MSGGRHALAMLRIQALHDERDAIVRQQQAAKARLGQIEKAIFLSIREDIARPVARLAEISVDDLLGRGRRAHEAAARVAFFWLACERAGLGYSVLGRLLNRDHTTIRYAHQTALDNAAARRLIDALMEIEDAA